MDIVFELVSWGFYAYYLLIFIYIIMSWIPQARESAVAYAIARLVEPYLSVFREHHSTHRHDRHLPDRGHHRPPVC